MARVHSLLVGVLVMLLATTAWGAQLSVGDAAPSFSGIGVDDQKRSLEDYKDAKAVVVVFTCNHCPVAVAYEDRLVAFDKEYKAKGVQLVAINVNNAPADRLDKMKERATEKGFTFPYLYDSSQKSGKDYGAKVTPHFFLLDKERKVAYVGAMDDGKNPAKVKTHFLRDAVDAVLKGAAPPLAETKAVGCGIKYE